MKSEHYARSKAARVPPLVAVIGVLALALGGCAGGAGGQEGGGGPGYEFGASQDEINQAIEGLDPVTITYQASAASENSLVGPANVAYAEAIEEMSNGQITVDIVWGQAIAPYGEVYDALADGRVDLSYALPTLDPDEFPGVNAIGDALGGADPSPHSGELIVHAAATELGWNTPEIIDNYEDKGVYPLVPVVAGSGNYTICNEPVITADDFEGKQVRVAQQTLSNVMRDIGASPVSMEYAETFEALQRGTVDCTIARNTTSVESGLFEVAPNISYTTTTSLPRSPGALLAGQKFAQLPLAYQQILFDAYIEYDAGQMTMMSSSNAEAVKQAKGYGGDVQRVSDDVQQVLDDALSETRERLAESGAAGDDLEARVEASIEKWTQKVNELGYTDGGDVEDMDEWHDSETDFNPIAEAIYEESMLPNRPD